MAVEVCLGETFEIGAIEAVGDFLLKYCGIAQKRPGHCFNTFLRGVSKGVSERIFPPEAEWPHNLLMNRQFLPILFLSLAFAAGSAAVRADDAVAAFDKVEPLLMDFCYDCHGDGMD